MTFGFRYKGAHLAAGFLLIAAVPAPARPVLLISIDGLGPNYVLDADRLGMKLPNLRRLVTEGSYAEGVRGVVPTLTCPSHATIVTGVLPSRHGITGNDPLKTDGFSSALCTFAGDIKADTLWDAAARAGIASASVGWLNTAGSPSIKYNLPQVEPYESDISVKFQEAMAQPPGLLRELEGELGSYYQDSSEAGSEIRLRFATEILRRYRPGFMLFHIVAVDHAAHGHGPWSDEARRAAEHEDAMVGRLIETALANDPDTVVVVVSDHGQLPVTHAFNINIPFVEAGLIAIEPPRPGQSVRVTDWTVRKWGDAILLKDPSDVATRARVSTLLHRLAADPANGIDRIVEGSEVEKLGGYPGAAFVIAMRPGMVLGGDYLGDRLVTFPAVRGTHGYLPEIAGMNAAFFVKGKGIERGRDLGMVDMRRIAPTVAAIMGVRLKDATEAPLPIFGTAGNGAEKPGS